MGPVIGYEINNFAVSIIEKFKIRNEWIQWVGNVMDSVELETFRF